MGSSRGKKLAYNTATSLLLQLISIASGFIVPRLILGTYGSNVNGLVNSVTQFLGVITLLDLGVGAVVQSSLYKPLANKDGTTVSKIFVSANRFFKRLALMLLIYVVVLMTVYPLIVNKNFGFFYTVTLIGSICISSFAQYYFGIVNSLLLTADQKGYIQYTAQIVAIIINTVACAILIKLGCTIQIVKLTTSLIFLCRPLFLNWYVQRHYEIDRKITYDEEPIKQKWNGMAQHFASYVLGGTDNIVLTLFSTLSNVSIYSVYNLVANGVFMIITSISNGFSSYFGDVMAKQENDNLKNHFIAFEWLIHTVSIFVFGCTSVVITDFILVYTKGINDAEYKQPLFAFILTIAFAVRSIRIPYNYLILAASRYKETQRCYYIAMFLNIIISVVSVKAYGLIGVAIGTLIAMLYQSVWMAIYDYKAIIVLPKKRLVKFAILDSTQFAVCFIIASSIPLLTLSYAGWFFRSLIVAVIWAAIGICFNFVFYKNEINIIKTVLKRKR